MHGGRQGARQSAGKRFRNQKRSERVSSLSFDPNSIAVPNGSFVAGAYLRGSGEEIPVQRPSDGEVTSVVREATAKEVDDAVTQAHVAYRNSEWAHAEPRKRAAVMRHWADLVDQNLEELARLESLVSSRPISESTGRDVRVTGEILRFYGECTDKVNAHVFRSAPTNLNFTEHEPYGVVAAISPWNVPLLLAAIKIAPAIAAGNAVVLKPSELTPYSILRLAELGVQAGLPKNIFNVLIGRGHITGMPLVQHPLVRYVAFTGSSATGALIMSEAAKSGLKPVSLELGGKNPQVVFADVANVDTVADVVAAGMTRNSGQLCFCGSRLIVERKLSDELVDKVAKRIKNAKAGPTWEQETTLPPIISMKQAERIEDILRASVKDGAEIVAGGKRFGTNGAAFFEPTLVVNAKSDNPVVREEVFGPVMVVQTFEDAGEAIKLADHPLYGLTAGVHTSDINKALKAARSIEAGTVWINSYGRGADIASPFGGYKQSGFGKDFGVAGYEKYLRSKSISIAIS
jgi:aldehyde dehydrogenase (NAD+)